MNITCDATIKIKYLLCDDCCSQMELSTVYPTSPIRYKYKCPNCGKCVTEDNQYPLVVYQLPTSDTIKLEFLKELKPTDPNMINNLIEAITSDDEDKSIMRDFLVDHLKDTYYYQEYDSVFMMERGSVIRKIIERSQITNLGTKLNLGHKIGCYIIYNRIPMTVLDANWRTELGEQGSDEFIIFIHESDRENFSNYISKMIL